MKSFYSPTRLLCLLLGGCGVILAGVTFLTFNGVLLPALGWVLFAGTWLWYSDVFETMSKQLRRTQLSAAGGKVIIQQIFGTLKELCVNDEQLKNKIEEAGFKDFTDMTWDNVSIKAGEKDEG
jgi:hypothetical protein